MAETVYKLEDVALDYTRMDWPLYRGAKALPVYLVQSADRFKLLEAACVRAKGRVTLSVQCSARAGTRAPAQTVAITNIRVADVWKRADATCMLELYDARKDVEQWLCKTDLNILYRDGYLDGTRAPTMPAALRMLLADILPLFEAGAFTLIDPDPVPDDLLYSGAMLGAPLDDLLSRFGVHLTANTRNQLTFATREDIGARVVKGTYSWVRGNEPGWLQPARTKFRKARKLRYYYRRRLAVLAEIERDNATAARAYLKVSLEQVYQDGDQYLTLEELLRKYEPAAAGGVNDTVIGTAFMSENLEKTPIERDGSANRDALIRIIKADWRRLYRVKMTDSRVGLGALSDLAVGVFRAITTPTPKQAALGLRPGDITGEVEAAGGVRGEWSEFLSVISGGSQGILNLSSVTQHKRVGTVLPAAPYAATWENPDSGILRFKQDRLPDNNFAILANLTNPDDMRIQWRPTRSVQTASGPVATRWGLDAPARGLAKLQASEALALLVGTQRLPNNAEKFEVVELEGDPNGDLDVQEFEVNELPAIFDFIDTAGRIDGNSHPALNAQYERGQWLNRDVVRKDAERRRELYLLDLERNVEGPGVAAGVAPLLTERVSGSLASMVLQLNGVAVTTQLVVSNLATDAARAKRAERRAVLRRAAAGGKVIEAS